MKPPFQFGLKAVFAATAGAAALMAVFHYVPLDVLFRVAAILSFWITVFVYWVRLCLWTIECRQPPDDA